MMRMGTCVTVFLMDIIVTVVAYKEFGWVGPVLALGTLWNWDLFECKVPKFKRGSIIYARLCGLF